MNIKLPIKIHNRFDIEVKDVTTGEIVQRGQAENIVLNNCFEDKFVYCTVSTNPYIGHYIMYGSGTGLLSPSRTTLFEQIGYKQAENVELIANQAPYPSYGTKKIVIIPSEHIGEIFTEVGNGQAESTTTIYTHALIKDSEGNLLSIGPKTDNQEITIYRTVYFQPNFEDGITLRGELGTTNKYIGNGLLLLCTMYAPQYLSYFSQTNEGTRKSRLIVNDDNWQDEKYAYFLTSANGVSTTGKITFLTSEKNKKIKKLGLGSDYNYAGSPNNSIQVDLEILAQNNSTIWSGYEFDQTPIGIGDGTTQIFTLAWDEAWLTKPYAVYVDGVEATSGVTFNAGNITFDTAPTDQAVITADYWVKYIPKDSDHELWVEFILNFGEGAPV